MWTWTWNKKGKIPSIWEDLYKLLKRNHFQAVCEFKKKNVEGVEENETNIEVFSVKNKNKNVEKNWTEEKDIILKVKINNFDLDMQMDTGTAVTFIPGNFCEPIRKPTLQMSSLLLCQFDGSVIKSLRHFEGFLELEDKFEVIPIIVTTCNRNHRLLGNDVHNINSTKLINEMKMEKNGKLKNYKASLELKENVTSSDHEARKLPVHLLLLVLAKQRKQYLLEHVPHGGSKWTSSLVVLSQMETYVYVEIIK